MLKHCGKKIRQTFYFQLSDCRTFPQIVELHVALCCVDVFWAGCHFAEPDALYKQCKTTSSTEEAAFTLVEAVSPTITSYFHLADRQNICQGDFSWALHTSLVVSSSFSSEINKHTLNILGKQLTLHSLSVYLLLCCFCSCTALV